MPKPKAVSLTTFVDFVSKAGMPKVTVVDEFKNRDSYQPAFDFYKAVRNAIVDVHEHGKPKKMLDDVLVGLDPKKVSHYSAVVKGHKKFIGKHTMKWFNPPAGVWSGGGIDVKMNPELGLEIDGTRYVVKMYFKPDPLPKKSIPIIVRMMEKSLACSAPVTFAVLNVRKAVLHAPQTAVSGLDGLLVGEAMNFASIFANV